MAQRIRVFQGYLPSGKLKEEDFLRALVNSSILLDESYESSKIGGEIYAALKKTGNLINDADILIAGIVKHYDAVLVTNNEGHFKRVTGLKIENWLVK